MDYEVFSLGISRIIIIINNAPLWIPAHADLILSDREMLSGKMKMKQMETVSMPILLTLLRADTTTILPLVRTLSSVIIIIKTHMFRDYMPILL